MANYKIYEELKTLKNNYIGGRKEIIQGLYFSMYQTVRMCEFYANSTYLKSETGKNKDVMGKDKPFYNIVNYRVTLAKTATDLDIKDIQVVSDNPKHWVKSMFLNKEVYKWMKDANFSKTLNDMGYTRPKYGAYLLKKTEDEDGELCIDVVEWKNVFCNQTNILGNPIVEKHYMSPVELKNKEGAWNDIDTVLKANKKVKKENQSNDIEVYEIKGELPVSMLKEYKEEKPTDEDEFTFSLQHYFIAEVNGKEFCLYGEELKGKMEDYYKKLDWEVMSGRDFGKGVIEDSEEAQVWTNDAVVNEKNAMDLAGKVVLKTTDPKIASNIMEVDNGKIFNLGDGKDISSFNLVPSALGEFQNQIEKWKDQASNATSSYDAITGEQPPSGTPYSQTALLNQVASKPFDQKREDWGIHLTEVFEDWVIPYVVKNLYKKHILASEFSDEELQIIDESFTAGEMKKHVIDNLIKGIPTSPEQYQQGVDNIKAGLTGKKRYIEFPEGYFDDIDADVTIITTGEQKNKAAILESLSNIMQTVIQSFNPNTGTFGVFDDPRLSQIFGTIIELSGAGISPVALGLGGNSKPANPQPAPQQAQQPSPLQAQSAPVGA